MNKVKIVFLVAIASAAIAAIAMAGESKYDTETSGVTSVVFKHQDAGWKTEFTSANHGTSAAKLIKFYGRKDTSPMMYFTGSETNAATVIDVANTGIASNDTIAVVYSDGAAPSIHTVTAATTTNVTVSSGITQAGTTKDFLVELGQVGQIYVDATSKAVNADYRVYTPGSSVLYVTMETATNAHLTVTAAPK